MSFWEEISAFWTFYENNAFYRQSLMLKKTLMGDSISVKFCPFLIHIRPPPLTSFMKIFNVIIRVLFMSFAKPCRLLFLVVYRNLKRQKGRFRKSGLFFILVWPKSTCIFDYRNIHQKVVDAETLDRVQFLFIQLLQGFQMNSRTF